MPAPRRDRRTARSTPAIPRTGWPTGPVKGSNSFTEGEARSRIEDKGFSNVSALKKDDDGIWRGRAMKSGQQVDVALDYQGNVFHGAAAHGMSGQTLPAQDRA